MLYAQDIHPYRPLMHFRPPPSAPSAHIVPNLPPHYYLRSSRPSQRHQLVIGRTGTSAFGIVDRLDLAIISFFDYHLRLSSILQLPSFIDCGGVEGYCQRLQSCLGG